MPWRELTGDIPKKRLRLLDRIYGGRAKYLIDESLGVGVFQTIRALGHNVKYGPDLGLAHRSDQEVFAKAWDEKRVILTHDNDFMNDQEFPFHRNPGVILVPGASGPSAIGLAEAISTVLNIIGHYGKMFRHPKIVITADNVWHVRTWEREAGYIRTSTWRFAGGKRYVWDSDDVEGDDEK